MFNSFQTVFVFVLAQTVVDFHSILDDIVTFTVGAKKRKTITELKKIKKSVFKSNLKNYNQDISTAPC